VNDVRIGDEPARPSRACSTATEVDLLVIEEELFVERADGGSDDDETAAPMVEISVEDAGSGVPEAERTRIFDRFNRGDQGGARGMDIGVGLGLALAAEHARLQGGRVWVEDRHDAAVGPRPDQPADPLLELQVRLRHEVVREAVPAPPGDRLELGLHADLFRRADDGRLRRPGRSARRL
jgi:signal transduction histidine kinase